MDLLIPQTHPAFSRPLVKVERLFQMRIEVLRLPDWRLHSPCPKLHFAVASVRSFCSIQRCAYSLVG